MKNMFPLSPLALVLVLSFITVMLALYLWSVSAPTPILSPMIGGASNVILYSKCNYTGTATPVTLGPHRISEFGSLAPIMSIKVPAGLTVTMIKTGGGTLNLNTSVSCFYLTRYMISSITVSKTGARYYKY